MTHHATVMRAQLGRALRSQASELNAMHSSADTLPPLVDQHTMDIARDVERAAPGLALMLQLRARLFDHALYAARRRGIEQVIAIGCGFDDARLGAIGSPRVRVLDVEHSAVLALKSSNDASRVERVAVESFDHGLWMTLDRIGALRRRRTLFLVQNGSFWPDDHAFGCLLGRFHANAGLANDLLLNVFDHDQTRSAAGVPFYLGGAGPTWVAMSVNDLLAQARNLHLAVRAVFDSHDLQRSYLGLDDLLIRESYLWITNAQDCARVATTGTFAVRTVTSRSDVTRQRWSLARTADRPRLRDGLFVRWVPPLDGVLLRPITPLRRVGVTLDRLEMMTALSLDGRRTLGDIARAMTTLARRQVETEVRRAAARLRAAGLLAEHPGAAEPTIGGPQTNSECLCDDVLIGEAPTLVRVRRSDDEGFAARVLDDARDLCARIASTLGLTPHIPVLVDVAAERAGIPLTYVETADPHTVVRIPRPNYSRQVLSHELTHVFAMADSLWLSEGLAIWMQRRIAPGPCFPDDEPRAATPRVATLPRGSLLERLLPNTRGAVASLQSSMGRSRAAYREAARFVEFFVRRFGFASFLAFFGACGRASSPDDITRACRQNGCDSLVDVERLWRDDALVGRG